MINLWQRIKKQFCLTTQEFLEEFMVYPNKAHICSWVSELNKIMTSLDPTMNSLDPTMIMLCLDLVTILPEEELEGIIPTGFRQQTIQNILDTITISFDKYPAMGELEYKNTLKSCNALFNSSARKEILEDSKILTIFHHELKKIKDEFNFEKNSDLTHMILNFYNSLNPL